MRFPAKVNSLEDLPLPPKRKVHLAIGMFDGVHLGHRQVIKAAVHSARRCGGIAAVLTFNPHPSHLFRPPGEHTRLLIGHDQKVRFLHELGVDLVIQQVFDARFASIEADDFLPYLIRCIPTLDTVYVGMNWRFGRQRKGDVIQLTRQGRELGIHVLTAERLHQDGEPISSTRIRDALAAGEIELVNSLLGYVYFCEGPVVPGRKIGSTIGFPTLNIDWTPDLSPPFGVYVVRAGSPSKPGLPAVANFGIRPTVNADPKPLLEVHLLGQDCPFGSGDVLRVEWLKFLRPEAKFDGLDALREQIAKDRADAEAYFQTDPPAD